jgi:hypothetical protein
MDTNRHIIAVTELVLIFPSALFMTAVVARHLPPLQSAAQRIVTWYSVRYWTLPVLLIGLPFAALLAGCITLLSNRDRGSARLQAAGQSPAEVRTDLATRIVAVATVLAGAVLVVAVVHMLAN